MHRAKRQHTNYTKPITMSKSSHVSRNCTLFAVRDERQMSRRTRANTDLGLRDVRDRVYAIRGQIYP